MLILNPGLMGSMDDDHLIWVLECEPAIMRTPAEIELIKRLEAALEELVERPEADAIDARVTEAIAQYPEEDFLEKLADRVFKLGEKPTQSPKNLPNLGKPWQVPPPMVPTN